MSVFTNALKDVYDHADVLEEQTLFKLFLYPFKIDLFGEKGIAVMFVPNKEEFEYIIQVNVEVF